MRQYGPWTFTESKMYRPTSVCAVDTFCGICIQHSFHREWLKIFYAPILMTPSNVPCTTMINQRSSTTGEKGTNTVAAAPPVRQTPIIRSQNAPNLSTRTPPVKWLTHYHTMPHFHALKIYSCKKNCEKRRNCL